jgi:putative oxidoreductase
MSNQSIRNRKIANVCLWILQILLAASFIVGGAFKLTGDVSTLTNELGMSEKTPSLLIRFIGFSELLGAVGLIAPIAFRVKYFLTPLAALGIALIMMLALIMHMAYGDFYRTPVNLVLLTLCMIVYWGRTKLLPGKNQTE